MIRFRVNFPAIYQDCSDLDEISALFIFYLNMPLLEVHKLACRRGDRLLFQDLDFQLNEGELLLLEGRNGSGKTTLLKTLSLI